MRSQWGCLTFLAAASRTAFEKLHMQEMLNNQPGEMHDIEWDTFCI